MNDLVSIITPTFNSENYIEKTIESVREQIYQNWEMIIVDDCSDDATCLIVEKASECDKRIHLLRQEENKGAAEARNRALQYSSGRFIAYLDADDIWMKDKLQKQVTFMIESKCGFSCVSYEVINDMGKPLNKKVRMLQKVDYLGFLTNNLLQTVGIMVDTELIDKKYLMMPDLRRRQDAATWLQILKAGYECYGMEEVLAQYRRTSHSLSSNKLKAVKGIWFLYRKVEKLSFPFSCYCFIRYAVFAVWKRIYIGRREKYEFTDVYKILPIWKR